MGFGLLIAGFILLFNPVIVVVDVIPDAIGFFLIVAGLSKMSCFIDKLAQARDGFLKLAFTEVVKFFSIALLAGTTGSMKVLLAFVFGLIEAMMFLPAVSNLFEGLSFAGLWYGGEAIYAKKAVRRTVRVRTKSGGETAVRKEKRTVQIEKLGATKRFIEFFYLFRIVATLIPELTELQMYDYLGTVDARALSLTSFKPLFYIFFVFVTLIFGVFYIVRVVRYFGAVRKDKPFIAAMERKYVNDILPKTTYFIAKNMKVALMLFGFSAGTSFLLPIDDVNILIGAISSGFLIAAAVIVGKYVKSAYIVIIPAALRAGLSILNFILESQYFGEYFAGAVLRVSDADHKYYTLASLKVVECVLAIASTLFFIAVLMKAVKAHLEVCGIQTENAQYSKRSRDLETYNVIGGKLLLTSILAIINTVMMGAYLYLLVTMSMVFVISIAISIVYAAYAIYSAYVINNLLYEKEIEMS